MSGAPEILGSGPGLVRRLWTALAGPTDEQLMWRWQTEEDPEACAELIRRWRSVLERLCTRMTGDAHLAEDLTQETFARLHAHRKEYIPQAKFSTYLWRLALNLCHDSLRRRRRRPEVSLEESEFDAVPGLEMGSANETTPETTLLASEEASQVRAALLRLEEPFRTVIVLRHYQDLKFREIAEVLDVPVGTVKSRMAEGLDRLHALLSHELEPASPNTKPKRREECLIL